MPKIVNFSGQNLPNGGHLKKTKNSETIKKDRDRNRRYFGITKIVNDHSKTFLKILKNN